MKPLVLSCGCTVEQPLKQAVLSFIDRHRLLVLTNPCPRHADNR